jgi:hypothetical protein
VSAEAMTDMLAIRDEYATTPRRNLILERYITPNDGGGLPVRHIQMERESRECRVYYFIHFSLQNGSEVALGYHRHGH